MVPLSKPNGVRLSAGKRYRRRHSIVNNRYYFPIGAFHPEDDVGLPGRPSSDLFRVRLDPACLGTRGTAARRQSEAR